MNKKNIFLMVTVLTTLTTLVKADHTNKTFLMPRPSGSVDLPMEVTTWENVVNRAHKKNNVGAHFQVTGFYNESQCGIKLGKYFGPCGKLAEAPPCPPETTCPQKGCGGALFSLQRNRNNDTSGAGGTNEKNTFSLAENIDLGYIIHKIDVTANETDKVTFGLNPEHNNAGVRFDYYQDLDCIVNGMFLRANLPIVHVENNLNFAVCSGDATLRQQIRDYFAGNELVLGDATTPDLNQSQEKLTKAKICGKQDTTGVADIDVALGYKFLDYATYYASIAVAITIPTGNEADGIWLFEPIVGNGHHFGVGGDIEGMYQIWGDHNSNLKLLFKAKYRYLFESSEKRTLGLKTLKDGAPSCRSEDCPTDCNGKPIKAERPWGHYTLLGCTGQRSLVPAANITTVNVQVTPGSQFDTILGLNYVFKGITFDIGYNLYYRESEDVILMGRSTDNCRVSCNVDFSNYAVAARGLDTQKFIPSTTNEFKFAINNASVDGGDVAAATLTADQASATGTIVTPRAAETPSQLTHSLYGGLGYVFDKWSLPLMAGIGGKYEWKDTNAAIQRWGIWGKLGIGF